MANVDVADRVSGLMGGRDRVRSLLNKLGYDTTDWVRVVMYRECFSFIESLSPGTLDTLEIAAGPQWKRRFRFKSYTAADYPAFDICEDRLDRKFDLIIADQVFEHLKWPQRAGKNVFAMLKPGGTFIVTTPFLIRLHDSPIDCSRWTETGMSYLLQECGFEAQNIKTASWGNRACVRANFRRWPRYGWYKPLHNERDFPVTIWAFAKR